jgi:hypothetical protein
MGYSVAESLRLVQHCEGDPRLSYKELASSWCGSCRNSLSACQCAALPRPCELSAITRAEKAAAAVSQAAVYGTTDRSQTQLQQWRRIRDLAGKNPDEVSRIANIEIQKLEAEVLDLWEILVPLASNDGVPFSELSKPCGCTVSTMDLSEARGLVLFRVIRGGIGITQRLGATGNVSSTGHSHTHPRTRASQRTD